MKFRSEKDSLGVKKVPAEAYYGVHTQRSIENFKISWKRFPRSFIKAACRLKKACAQANSEMKLLDARKAKAVARACDEIIKGKLTEQFPLDIFQAGSGTSTNMNINEVIANRANELLGKKKGSKFVHANDDVNKGQSTNNVIPSSARVALVENSAELLENISLLIKELKIKGKEFSGVLKSGRTHLQDAVPITLGQEFNAYAFALEKRRSGVEETLAKLRFLGIGGNAVGTGLNTFPAFRAKIIRNLNRNSKQKFLQAQNGVEATQFLTDIAAFSSALKLFAIDLNKISNDLRLLSSGPRTGFGEITLPAVEPGSSIMPGKINPSIAEATNMACIQVMGNDAAISIACAAGQLELNTHMPLIAFNAIESEEMLSNATRTFALKCVKGIKADREKCLWYVENSAALGTALNPVLGYDKVAELVKESLRKNKSIKQLVLEKKLLSKKDADFYLNPKNLTRPNLGLKRK